MKDYNKEKCKLLKEVRKTMANKLGVDLHQQECTYQGKCLGTCPKCKQEEEILNKAILQKTAIAGTVAAISMGMTGCSFNQNKFEPTNENLSNNVIILDEVEKEKDNSVIEDEEDKNDDNYLFNELSGNVVLIEE